MHSIPIHASIHISICCSGLPLQEFLTAQAHFWSHFGCAPNGGRLKRFPPLLAFWQPSKVSFWSPIVGIIQSLPPVAIDIGISKNRGGPPKSWIVIGFSIINHPFWIILGYHYFWKHPYIVPKCLLTPPEKPRNHLEFHGRGLGCPTGKDCRQRSLLGGVTLPRTNSLPLKIGETQKEIHLPTIHFQGLC